MSEYDELREDIGAVAKALDGYNATAVSHLLEQSRQIDKLWKDNGELRDELYAVANRLENLTRAVTTSPAEVAAAIVNDANRETLRAVGPFPKDERVILSPYRWHECSECGTDIRRGASDGLIYDAEGLHTCKASA